MSQAPALPEIEGATDSTATDKAQEEKTKTLTQAAEMDLPTPQAVETTEASRDVSEKESTEVKIKQEEEVQKTATLSAKKMAQLEQARAARKQKAEIRRLEGKQAAQGSPAPDLLQEIVKHLDDRFAPVLKRLDDFQLKFAQEEVVKSKAKETIKLPSQSETYMDVPVNRKRASRYDENSDSDDSLSMNRERHRKSEKRRRQSQYLDKEPNSNWLSKELEHYQARNQKAMETFRYQNEPMEKRASQAPEQQGTSQANIGYTMW